MSARGTGYASGILSRNSQVGDRYKQYSKAYRRTEDLLVLYERSVFYQVFYSSEHLADRKLNFQDLHRAPVPPARAEPSGSSGRHRRQRRSQALASYVARRVSCTPLCSRLLFTPSCLAPRRTAASAAAARRRRRRRRCRPTVWPGGDWARRWSCSGARRRPSVSRPQRRPSLATGKNGRGSCSTGCGGRLRRCRPSRVLMCER